LCIDNGQALSGRRRDRRIFVTVPVTIKDRVANARYYFDAAGKLPRPTQDAAHILLLLVGWENIAIADAELNAWANGDTAAERLYKDHASKLHGAPEILRVIIGPSGTKPREIRFTTGRDFAELRLACQYGSSTESKSVQQIFERGWHPDSFQRELKSKIEWVELFIGQYEKLDS
jgi:hypothetical protein